MPTHKRPDVDLYYEIAGYGPPLLLIPGMLSDSTTWLPLLPFIQDHYTVIRVDNRATGRMQDCGPFTLPDCAADIAALAEHLDLKNLHAMGHSMGGYLTLMLADLIPDRLASLTLLTSAATNGHRNFILFQHALKLYQDPNMPKGFWLKNLFPWLMSPSFFANPANLENAVNASLLYPFAQTATSMERQTMALTGFANRNPKTPLPCRAQAILGDRDLLFPEPDARAALAPIPNLEIHTIANAAHSIHWEQPADVAKALMNFTNA